MPRSEVQHAGALSTSMWTPAIRDAALGQPAWQEKGPQGEKEIEKMPFGRWGSDMGGCLKDGTRRAFFVHSKTVDV